MNTTSSFTYFGVAVIVLGYCGSKVLIRLPHGGKVAWVGMERIK